MVDDRRHKLDQYSRPLQREFILMYKESPSLWDRTSDLYQNRKAKELAIARLVALVRPYFPNTHAVLVMKKIDVLRSCYRRERRKAHNSAQYKPKLWYYNLMTFLGEHIENLDTPKPKRKVESEEEENLDDNVYMEEEEENYDTYILNPEDEQREESTFLQITPDICLPSPTNKQEQNDSYTDYEQVETNIASTSSKKRHFELIDEFDAIGVNVAAKLRTLPINTRVVAEKLIHDVLYQAQTNRLTINSQIVTKDPIN